MTENITIQVREARPTIVLRHVDALSRGPKGDPSGSAGRLAAYAYHTPQDLTSSELSMAGPYPLPDTEWIVFDNQADSAENGLYLADGAGGIVLGSHVGIDELTLGAPIFVSVAFYDWNALPSPAWDGSSALMAEFYRERSDAFPNPVVGEELRAVNLGAGAFLLPTHGLHWMAANIKQFYGNDILDSTSTSGSPYRMGLHPLVYVADTHDADRYVELGPHATLIRWVALHNDGTGLLHVANKPGDGVTFSTTLAPGTRCLIFPNQAKWERWDLPPQFKEGDENKLIGWDADGNLVSIDVTDLAAGVQSLTATSGVELSGTATAPVIGLDWPVVRAVAGRPALTYPDDLGKHLIATSDGEGNAVPFWANPEVPDSSAQDATATLHPDGDGGVQWGTGVSLVDGMDGNVDLSGSYEALGNVSSGIAAHVAASDPHGDRAYIDTRLAALDVMQIKGGRDCSTNPNFPAADAGDFYYVTVAGKIGGASGPNVEVGDTLICFVDSSAAGTYAAVGANWVIGQINLDGAVVGPSSATDGHIPLFNGSTGKIIKTSGVSLSTATFAASQITNLTTDLAAKVPNTRTVAGLDLSADRTAAALRTALGLTSFATLATGTAGYVVGADATEFALGGVPLGTPSGGSQNYGVPGVSWSGVTANTMAANTILYLPFIVTAPITVDRLIFECTTANSGKSVVMGLYAATSAWQPTGAALADTGAVSVTSPGVKASTVSAALAPGRYLLTFLNEHASTGLRYAVPTMPTVCEIDAATMGGTANVVTTHRSATLTFATSLPNTGPAWTSTKGASPAVHVMMLMRWSLT